MWGITNRSRNDSQEASSPKSTPEQVTAHKSWRPGAPYPTRRQLLRLEPALSRWLYSSRRLDEPLPFPGRSTHLRVFLICSYSLYTFQKGEIWCIWQVSGTSWSPGVVSFLLISFCAVIIHYSDRILHIASEHPVSASLQDGSLPQRKWLWNMPSLQVFCHSSFCLLSHD